MFAPVSNGRGFLFTVKSRVMINDLKNLAKKLGATYLTIGDLKKAFPYDAATGWQNFNAAKMTWWNSKLRKP